jgi:hypothetical protein
MKKLAILLITISLSVAVNAEWSVYTGYFGNSIEGAFGLELGEKKKIDPKESTYISFDAYTYIPKYPLRLNLFHKESYYFRLTAENKIYSIELLTVDESTKCDSTSGRYTQLLSILEKKYGEMKLMQSFQGKGTKLRYTDGDRSITLSCEPRLIGLRYEEDTKPTARTIESIL